MLLAIAFLLGFIWVISFLVYNVASVAIHVLVLAAIVSAIVHFIRVRRLGRSRPRASAADAPISDEDPLLTHGKPGAERKRADAQDRVV
jgi:hypothetical protein